MARDEHKKHKKEKHKKRKKERKKKHKKEKSKSKHYSSTSSSLSESDSDETHEIKKVKTEDLSQHNWNFLEAALNESSVHVQNKKPKSESQNILDRPGQHARELNPYWKDNGCGLPPESLSSQKSRESSNSENFSVKRDSDFRRDSKPSSRFLKPGEGSAYEVNKNTFQRNWKKKGHSIDNTTETRQNPEQEETKTNEQESTFVSKALTKDDLNTLGAKLLKAEIMGNKVLVEKLKAQLESAKKIVSENSAEQATARQVKEVVVITGKGSSSLKKSSEEINREVPSKKKKIETHNTRERVRYFPDDDKYSLKNLFEREKAGYEEDDVILKSRLAGKNQEDLDDAYLEAAASSKIHKKQEERLSQASMQQAVKKHKSLEGCHWCLDNRNQTRHLIVSTGSKCYLSLPEEESLTEGHCFIVPLHHETSTMHVDEDVWDEIKMYQKALTKMFLSEEKDVVFFENARSFKHYPHCFVQCVPLEKEVGETAPLYFQKALSESETEWSHNKKVVDFRKQDLRKKIPKGLPYFAISFGTDGGFAHIIEDERLFKRNFAEEVLGGMMDLDPYKWRKPKKENFRTQRDKTLEFLKNWKKFEFNKKSLDSSSESD